MIFDANHLMKLFLCTLRAADTSSMGTGAVAVLLAEPDNRYSRPERAIPRTSRHVNHSAKP